MGFGELLGCVAGRDLGRGVYLRTWMLGLTPMYLALRPLPSGCSHEDLRAFTTDW